MKEIKFYLAPLEGITTMGYRNAYDHCFAPLDKYFTPFLVPHSKKGFSTKEKREVVPENNQGIPLIPQIMSNQAENCIQTIEKLAVYGYKEVNLNMGCPSRTVVSKKRGSGFLAYPEELRAFLDQVCNETAKKGIGISVKTRIGKNAPDELIELLDIYNEFPLTELIIHPRVQSDFYKGTPRMEWFTYAYEHSKNPVCYNGDIYTVSEFWALMKKYPNLDRIMIGRGILRNPFLIEWIKESLQENNETMHQASECPFSAKELERIRSFHDEVLKIYQNEYSGEANVLFKMKEIWTYLGNSFPEYPKQLKAIRKAQHLDRYSEAVNVILK